MEPNGKTGILFTLALLFEVVGVILFIGPFGSSLANFAWGNWLTGWIVVCGAMLLAPWALRWLGGPKPFRLFSRGTSFKFTRLLYVGLLLGIIITAYKALLCLALRLSGIPFDAFLTGWRFWGSDESFLAVVALSMAGAYFVFGYIQGLAARVFGERGGMLLAALLFALGSAWPFYGSAADIAGLPAWIPLVALHLPVGIGLAYLGSRTRSLFPVLAAVLVMSWLSGLASVVYSTLGALITALVMIVMLLIGSEVIVGERRRVKRFAVGFFKDAFAKGEGGLVDTLIFIVAVIASLFAVWVSEMFYAEWYVILTIPIGLLIISGILWAIYSIIRRKRENKIDR